jgi:hypothetical protein
MRRVRACSRFIAILLVASACTSPVLADEMKAVPDVRLGMAAEIAPFGDAPFGALVLHGSAHPVRWLSIGAEGSWGTQGYAYALIGPEPVARNPFHVFGVARLHASSSRRVEGSFGMALGLTGERWLYRDADRPALGEYAKTRYAFGGGPIVGLHLFLVDALAFDVENLIFLSSLSNSDRVAVSFVLRLGLSVHFR